jgi:hypothetical protein
MRKRKLRGKIAGVLLAVFAVLGIATAAAYADTPAAGYGQFAGCPSKAELPVAEGCTTSVIRGGHFQLGSKDVPLSEPISLSGGFTAEGKFVANSKGGLEQVKEQVPGGIIGLTGLDWLVNLLNVEQLKLYAVTELVGEPSLFGNISLPVRAHLVNLVLGNKCYVGSSSSPINLNLTDETTSPPPPNEPISGVKPEFLGNEETGIITLRNGIYVDNSFSAPGASGCTLTLFGFLPLSLDGLVDAESGLPAAAGTNETAQNIDIDIVPVERVYP